MSKINITFPNPDLIIKYELEENTFTNVSIISGEIRIGIKGHLSLIRNILVEDESGKIYSAESEKLFINEKSLLDHFREETRVMIKQEIQFHKVNTRVIKKSNNEEMIIDGSSIIYFDFKNDITNISYRLRKPISGKIESNFKISDLIFLD